MVIYWLVFVIVVCLGLSLWGFSNKLNLEREHSATLLNQLQKSKQEAQTHSKSAEELKKQKADIESSLKVKEQEALQKQQEIDSLNTKLQAKAQMKAATVSLAKATPVTTPKIAAPAVSGGSVWDSLAQCESGGRWDYNGGSGYDGGIQFLPSTWNAMNTGYAFAWQAPREVQIAAGEKLLAQSGWGQWPACASKLGLR